MHLIDKIRILIAVGAREKKRERSGENVFILYLNLTKDDFMI